jgi:hypothetical protein
MRLQDHLVTVGLDCGWGRLLYYADCSCGWAGRLCSLSAATAEAAAHRQRVIG